jgi:hypothetical protein
MAKVVDEAAARGRGIVRWCLLDVLERCPAERACDGCPLWEECRGVAKHACDGFFLIDDAITMKCRVSQETWQSEMLCRRPLTRGRVFAGFCREVHVVDQFPAGAEGARPAEISYAIDFGYRNPFVCLWMCRRGETICVLDEYQHDQRTTEQNMAAVEAQNRFGRVARVYCDPAGRSRNDQTAQSNVDALRARGYTVCCRSSHIADGLELIRAALRPAHGPPRLFVQRNCRKLIEALQSYRYPESGGEVPLKDNTHDHPIDALRYYFIHQRTSGRVQVVRY